MKFKDGDKVKVLPHIWWPDGGTGKVSLPPEYVAGAVEGTDAFDSTQRTVKGVNSIVTSIWVEFDEPVQDLDGDGPYVSGEVQIEYLEHLQ
ncbi:hypothetical protein ACFOEK_12820 [Litoribrevibacter euphylliae]|uniref:Uncharacterized protein n=1 Tax=Litoribrevibacter euphylliae TaxID=1834034 RepID=A0ABV7HK76_9GAMM